MVLRVKGVGLVLKMNVKKSTLLRLGISEDENVMLGKEKID